MDQLQKIRKSRGLSRKELSQYSGVSIEEIKHLELGYHNVECVKLQTLIALAKVLKCKVVDFLPKEERRKIR